jgi:hypothetical protein
MSIRLVSCLIRVDEELLDCDFSHPAASIEESVTAWEGCTIARWDDPDQGQVQIEDETSALDKIAAVLSGTEWDADTCLQIAELIRSTGREVLDL